MWFTRKNTSRGTLAVALGKKLVRLIPSRHGALACIQACANDAARLQVCSQAMVLVGIVGLIIKVIAPPACKALLHGATQVHHGAGERDKDQNRVAPAVPVQELLDDGGALSARY